MLSKKIELLAPAGNMECFLAAVNAGADAIYLAGEKFGARAYANNFTQEEIQEALYYAHIRGKKIYLTVNTLVKGKELEELPSYLLPLYQSGLDGVIVQDFGVAKMILETFPKMEIHASTQMCITSLEGASFFTNAFANRIVLARELGLNEIKEITAAGIETECFIHGAMCYSYSGQCLFSSLIGGRSGNRGRCAQPCRLPYSPMDSKNEQYCLSLKDMCMVESLPSLLEAGITSFKIEGRMKSAAYVAGVTSIYRKYIDLYCSNPENYRVKQEDLNRLKHLYIRSSVENGYYFRNHGKEMITINNPAYSKTDEALSEQITEEYVRKEYPILVNGKAEFCIDSPAKFTVSYVYNGYCFQETVYGEIVQNAQKAPLQETDISNRLHKTGNTGFALKELEINLQENSFLPVKAINELRRLAFEKMKERLYNELCLRRIDDGKEDQTKENFLNRKTVEFEKRENNSNKYIVFLQSIQQWNTILNEDFSCTVAIPFDWVDTEIWSKIESICEKHFMPIRLILPETYRNTKREQIIQCLNTVKDENIVEGIYVNQMEYMSMLNTICPNKKRFGDLGLYAMNPGSISFLEEYLDGLTIPVELNKDELKHLDYKAGELMIYGRIPLMQTANCVLLTNRKCIGNQKNCEQFTYLNDRKGATLPIKLHCNEKPCGNTIYNSVPTSLHKHLDEIAKMNYSGLQLRFTNENEKQIREVLKRMFSKDDSTQNTEFSFTNGHFLRGIQ